MNWLDVMKSYEENFIKDLRGLLQIPSIKDVTSIEDKAPFGKGCKDALTYMLHLARSQGFVTKDIDGYAGVIEYGEGQESVGVLAHIDVVPIGKGWTKDPFAGEIVDGYIFGRGTMDDKGPAMASFYALKMLRDQGIKLNKKVMLILGCDEESGMQCMEYYATHAEIPSLGFTPDAHFPVIYGEKGGMHIQMYGACETNIIKMHAGERANIVIGEASAEVDHWQEAYYEQFLLYLKVNDLQGDVIVDQRRATLHIKGVFAHAATPYNGVNAALHILHFIACAYDDAFAAMTYKMLSDWRAQPLGIAIEGTHMGCLTMNTGIVHIEKGRANITLDIRYPNDTTSDAIMQEVQKTVKILKYPLDIQLIKDMKPLFVDPTSPLVTTLADVYRTYTKDETSANMTIGGGTYAKKMPNFVAFGPEFPNTKHPKNMFIGECHQKDEAIKLDDLYMATAIYTAALEKLAK